MMINMLRTFIGIALLGVALTATACHRHHTPSERAERMVGAIAKHLNLDDQQKAKLEDVKKEALAAREEMRNEYQALMEAVIAQVQSERLDQAKMAQLIEQYRTIQDRSMARLLPKLAEWHASLLPGQKAEAVEHIRRWMDYYEGAH